MVTLWQSSFVAAVGDGSCLPSGGTFPPPFDGLSTSPTQPIKPTMSTLKIIHKGTGTRLW